MLKSNKALFIVLLLLCTCFIVSCGGGGGGGSNDKNIVTKDYSGFYEGHYTFYLGEQSFTHQITLDVNQTENKVSGTWNSSSSAYGTLTGTVSGETASITTENKALSSGCTERTEIKCKYYAENSFSCNGTGYHNLAECGGGVYQTKVYVDVVKRSAVNDNDEPFEVTYTWDDTFRIYGWLPVPQINGFDYYFTQEKVASSLAGKKVQITSVEISTPGTNLGASVNFDIEINLSGKQVELPEGQFIKTTIDPISGYSRIAETKYYFSIGNIIDSQNYTFRGTYNFLSATGTAYPYLGTIKVASNPEMNITDGLHAQLFFWTADNNNCQINFSGATLLVRGKIIRF
jgi:hypothetical protein